MMVSGFTISFNIKACYECDGFVLKIFGGNSKKSLLFFGIV